LQEFAHTFARGDDRTLRGTATYPEAIPEQDIEAGDPYPLTGLSVWFTAKHDFSDADEDAVIYATSAPGGGITVRPAPDAHVFDVEINGEDTQDLPNRDVVLHCGAQVRTGSGQVWTIARGIIVIEPDPTLARTL
jgi:hypothetical protein